MAILLHAKKIVWTNHALEKIRYYQLSKNRVLRVIRNPQRTEEGIVSDTIACMQKTGSSKNPFELWVMIQDKNIDRVIISAWRYPGVTKPGQPLPANVRSALETLVSEALIETEYS